MDKKNVSKNVNKSYRKIFKKIPSLALILDREGTILSCNDRIETLLGYEPGEVTNRRMDKLVSPVFREKIRKRIERTEDDDRFYENYVELLSKSGNRVEGNIRTSIIPEAREGTGKTVLIFEEITERQLGKLKTKLERIRKKNQDLEELIQTIFHDLQEPVRSIGSYMDILQLKHESDLPKESRSRIDRVKENAKRMESLLSDLSDISQLRGNNSFQLLQVPGIVKRLIQEFEKNMGDLTVEVQDGFPKVYFDPSQMKILLRNLIHNGLKFNDPPRRVLVGYERTPPGENIKLFVKDNGQGIAKEYREKVFEIFNVLNPDGTKNGTGAGLAICKRIVEDNGGEIWIDSELEKGTVVHFTVPIYEEDDRGGEFFSQFSLPEAESIDTSEEGPGFFDRETHLHNRKYFDQILEPRLKGYCEKGHDITFLVIKLSNYAKVKKTHGSGNYSKLLNRLISSLKSAIRRSDLMLRISEQTFMVILPRTSGASDEVKTRISTQISQLNSNSDFLDIPLKLNYGATVLESQDDPDPERAIREAESKLYQKHN